MKYKQCDEKMKAKIDVLLDLGLSRRAIGRQLNISHSTVSRYKNKVYRKRSLDISKKYAHFIDYLHNHYDRKNKSIEVCIHQYKRYYARKPHVSVQQVYNWIHEGKLNIKPLHMCYKRSKRKKKANGMMNHLHWSVANRTVLPISLRPQHIEERNEIGHLEIDSIIGKRNEYASIISIVDRCSRIVWLIKAEAKNEYYTMNLIHQYLVKENITVKSITVDNGLEFQAMGVAAKRCGVKLYKCDPYCSFQRGSNEHMNGIVRRYIPKGKSLYQIEQQYLDDISFKINSMPRKLFDFKSAYEIESLYTNIGAVEI